MHKCDLIRMHTLKPSRAFPEYYIIYKIQNTKIIINLWRSYINSCGSCEKYYQLIYTLLHNWFGDKDPAIYTNLKIELYREFKCFELVAHHYILPHFETFRKNVCVYVHLKPTYDKKASKRGNHPIPNTNVTYLCISDLSLN